MKKTLATLSALALLCGFASAQDDFYYGKEMTGGTYYPLQLSLYPTVQLIPFDGDFAGLRLNIIGVNRNVSGVDLGISNQSDETFNGVGLGVINMSKGDTKGLHVGFVNNTLGDLKGFQGIPLLTWFNAFNVVGKHCSGMQGGLYNEANSLSGFQGGIINVAYDAKGVMVGAYNYTESFQGLHVGLVNITYNDMTGCQIGLYNGVRNAHGFQLGLINQTQTLDGLQIGLVNVASMKERFPTMVFANWQF